MNSVVILGAGRIGKAIAKLLHSTSDYRVTLVDASSGALSLPPQFSAVELVCLDVNDKIRLVALLKKSEAVISACPYKDNIGVADAALEAGVSYFDLTENVDISDYILALSVKAARGQRFMPQCGLAPGFISILAHDLVSGFDQVESVKMRVGALPEFPNNQIMYNLTWSTEGLINEYCTPCRAIKAGSMVELQALEGLEHFSLDGLEYEAFNTSGGLGTLCQTLNGKVDDLTYKTIRYKGHQYLMNFLINGLQLKKDRELLKQIIENSVAVTQQDLIIIMVSVVGYKLGILTQVTDSRKIYHQTVLSESWSGIQVVTAASVCAIVDLHFSGSLPDRSFIRQEDVNLEDFLANRFGSHYCK